MKMTFIEWWQKLGIFYGRDTVSGLIEPMVFAALTWEAAQPEWRPIETAPKDTAIICCNELGNVGEACFISSVSNPAWYWAADVMAAPEWLTPTKWMPLPNPPEDQ